MASFVEAEDCGSAGGDGSTDASEELAKAEVHSLKPLNSPLIRGPFTRPGFLQVGP
jgi:hypothetical protein